MGIGTEKKSLLLYTLYYHQLLQGPVGAPGVGMETFFQTWQQVSRHG